MKRTDSRSYLLWIFLLAAGLLFVMNQVATQTEREITYSEFKSRLKAGEVQEVVIRKDVIRGKFKDDSVFWTNKLADDKLVSELEASGARFSSQPEREWVWSLVYSFGPIALIVLLWVLFTRQMASGGKQAMMFGKSRARMYTSRGKNDVTFKDVAGCDEVKEELTEIIEFLKDPKKFQRLGGKIPKGVLLFGPPGTGKTLLARAVAGEAGVPFFSASGSEFVEMFVGVGASRVRDLFEQGRRSAPCLLFIDELDAVGRHRFAGIGGGHDEREQTLNQLLVEMDGFDTREGVILIASTNRPDVLDPALLRPGRFDRQVVVPSPDIRGREEILRVHTRKLKLADDVNPAIIAQRTPGFVGADLANLCNEAALLAARRDKPAIFMADFDEAIEKVMAGPARKSRVISDKEKQIIAHHESGHTLVARFTPNADPVHKVSMIPRGPALGYTLQMPEHDKYITGRQELLDRITALLGGREAEVLVFGDVSTGDHNDLQKATDIATKMVCEYGMSDVIGPLSLRKREEEIFLGRDYLNKEKMYSEHTAQLIDQEIKRIVEECVARARTILTDNMDKLKLLAAELMRKEVLDRAEIDALLGLAPPHEQPPTQSGQATA